MATKEPTTSEHEVNSWHAHSRSNLDGVSSYVQFARFNSLVEWEEPALLTCALEIFNSLTALWIFETEISDGLPDHISCGDDVRKTRPRRP